MTIGTDIILDALENIGAHSNIAPASPTSIERGMKYLNSMLELWLSQNIQIGFTPLKAPGDELNEPPDTTNGIESNLAILLAPKFSNAVSVVSVDLKTNARIQLIQIKRIYEKITVPKKVVSSTLPTGSGNQRNSSNRRYFPKGHTING